MLEYSAFARAAMTFSNRLPPHAEINPLVARSRRCSAAAALADHRSDRVQSDTRVGLDYPADLARRARRRARPPLRRRSRSVLPSRERQSRRITRGAASRVDPAQVVLSASTSEAYSWLFKLLCNPGEAVLVPQPSYPLFEHLTRLEAVQAIPYHLRLPRTMGDRLRLRERRAVTRASAAARVTEQPDWIVLSSRDEARWLARCAVRAAGRSSPTKCSPTIRSTSTEAPTESVMNLDVLSFTLGGASKSLGLPQIKLGWTIGGRPASERARPSRRSRSSLTPFFPSAPRCRARRLASVQGRRRQGPDPSRESRRTWREPGRSRASIRRARCCRSRAGGRSSRASPLTAPKRPLDPRAARA